MSYAALRIEHEGASEKIGERNQVDTGIFDQSFVPLHRQTNLVLADALRFQLPAEDVLEHLGLNAQASGRHGRFRCDGTAVVVHKCGHKRRSSVSTNRIHTASTGRVVVLIFTIPRQGTQTVAMADKDLYSILGVPRAADAEVIKKTYRKLARKHHPDVN